MELDKYAKTFVEDHLDYAKVLDVSPFKGPTMSFVKSANIYLCCFLGSRDTFLLIDSHNIEIPSFINDKDIMSYLIFSKDTIQIK
jgi:hypothetical protein